MQKIMQKILQKLCKNYAKIMQKLCKNYAKIMQKLCKIYRLYFCIKRFLNSLYNLYNLYSYIKGEWYKEFVLNVILYLIENLHLISILTKSLIVVQKKNIQTI